MPFFVIEIGWIFSLNFVFLAFFIAKVLLDAPFAPKYFKTTTLSTTNSAIVSLLSQVSYFNSPTNIQVQFNNLNSSINL